MVRKSFNTIFSGVTSGILSCACAEDCSPIKEENMKDCNKHDKFLLTFSDEMNCFCSCSTFPGPILILRKRGIQAIPTTCCLFSLPNINSRNRKYCYVWRHMWVLHFELLCWSTLSILGLNSLGWVEPSHCDQTTWLQSEYAYSLSYFCNSSPCKPCFSCK